MRQPTLTLAFALAAALVGTIARSAEACSCANGMSTCHAFAATSIVFVGEVEATERVRDEFRMHLRVVRPLKGIETPTAELWSDASSSCGVKLEPGKRYVVFTSVTGGRMSIHACGYSYALEEGESELDLPPLPGRIDGQVTRYDVERIREFEPLKPIAGVRVALDLPTGRVATTSDARGRFQFTDIPPGRYLPIVDGGVGLAPWMLSPVTIQDRQDCAGASIVLWPAGKVSGVVKAADGQPPDQSVYIRLVPEKGHGSPLSQLLDLGQMTKPDGRFTFDGIAPDTYVLAVNPDGTDATSRQPYASTWYGGPDRASATRISVEEGAVIELEQPFVLRESLLTRTFTVAVTCRDGSVPPAVSARASTSNGDAATEYGERGADSIETLRVLRDEAYALSISMYIPDGPERPWKGPRRKVELRPTQLAPGEAGRHIALVAPFDNCAETAR